MTPLTDQKLAEMTKEHIEKVIRFNRSGIAAHQLFVEFQRQIERQRKELEQHCSAISEANGLLSNAVDYGGGTVALIKWVKAVLADDKSKSETIDRQRKEIEELKKDKALVDWIEQNANDSKGLLIAGICYWSVIKGKTRIGTGDDLREALNSSVESLTAESEGEK